MIKFFSFGFLLTLIGSAYIGNTVWTFYHIYFPSWCNANNPADSPKCIAPVYPCSTTKIAFEAWITRSSSLPSTFSQDNSVEAFTKEEDCEKEWEESVNVNIKNIYRNGATYYLHVFAAPVERLKKSGTLNPKDVDVMHRKMEVTKMLEEELTAINLITSEKGEGNSTIKRAGKKILHWHSKVRVHLMDTPIIFDRNSVPPEIVNLMKFQQSANGLLKYLPLLYLDVLSTKREEYIPLKDPSADLNLTINYTPMSVGKIRLIQMTTASFEQMKTFGLKESDLEDIAAIFTETNFYILTLTIVVTVLHLAFDFLAFKNDINFWRKKNTTVGLSGRTILWRAFSQIIVFLYLMEEKSSLLITVPGGIACVIEIWKVLKLWKFRGFERRGWRIIPLFDTISKAEKSCDDLDADFVRKLSYLLAPLCVGGAIYSLFYVPHKSWYSWTVQSAVNGVYAFGFLFMIPQLYLNYKLKSVAHLPWKVFSYKAINTFIDDLFAFIVKMPLAHRLACFRDDIVFVFYLVQLYLYPVDKSRANEFGQSFEESEEQEAKKNK